MKKMGKVISLAIVLTFMFNTICFADAFQPDTAIPIAVFQGTAGKSVAWIPTDAKGNAIMIQPTPNGTIYSRIIYLSKLEAIAVNEGYRDSAFKAEFKKVMDYLTSIGCAAGSFVLGAKIVEAAKVLNCTKVAAAFSGVGGAIVVGVTVETVINMIKDVNYDAFKNEISKTNENCWVQVKVGIASSPFVTVPVKEYKAWNSSKLYGMAGYYGQWVGPFADPVKPPDWM